MRIRDLREDADITQKEIAAYLHIRQNTYSQYENGQRQLPVNVLIALAKYYRLHHAIPMVQLRSRIFRQTIQKAAGCSGATAKGFCDV